nr:MFS transporter [Nocardiopsis gilva]
MTVDAMKPVTLGFVAPGMTAEYGLRSPLNPEGGLPVALLPLSGLIGTVVGSLLWGSMADRIGRRSAILLAGVLFVSTAGCGAMPSFAWNLVMCALMGVAAGGMLPITFSLLAETIPARHRGWVMVLIGGTPALAYALTGWLAAELIPEYSWRVLWLVGAPTGALLILLNRWLPESPRFLLLHGRVREATAIMAMYGATARPADAARQDAMIGADWASGHGPLFRFPFAGFSAAVVIFGIGIGLVTYGFQLWIPTNLRVLGLEARTTDQALRDSRRPWSSSTTGQPHGPPSYLRKGLAGGRGDFFGEEGELAFVIVAGPVDEGVHAEVADQFGQLVDPLLDGPLEWGARLSADHAVEVVDLAYLGRVAARLLRGGVDPDDGLAEAVEREEAERGHPAVGLRTGQAQSAGSVRTEPYPQPGACGRPGVQTRQPVVDAFKANRPLLTPHRADNVDRLIQGIDGFLWATARAAHGGDRVPDRPRAKAELDPPTGETMQAGSRLGQDSGGTQRQVSHGGHERDALGGSREIADQGPGVVEGALVGVILHADQVQPGSIHPPGQPHGELGVGPGGIDIRTEQYGQGHGSLTPRRPRRGLSPHSAIRMRHEEQP